MSDVQIPQLAFPLRLDAGDFAVLEQDSLEEITQSVFLLARTPLGVRPLAPEVGVEDQTFVSQLDGDQLAAQLQDQEPRAAVTVTVTPVDARGELTARVDVELAGTQGVLP